MTALNFHSMRERMKQQLKAEDAQRSSKESPSIFSLPPPIHFNCLTLEEEIRFSVGSIPSVYYIPDFMTRETESLLLKLIEDDPKKWTQLTKRRLKVYGGIPSATGMTTEPLPQWITAIAQTLADVKIFDSPPDHVLLNEYTPPKGIAPHFDGPLYGNNVAVLNMGDSAKMEFYEVLPQQHEVTVQSNGGDTDGIYNKDNDENQPKPVKQRLKVVMSLMLMPRSLLVFREDAYTVYKHGIPDSDIDLVDELVANVGKEEGIELGNKIERTGKRVSLTIRKAMNNKTVGGGDDEDSSLAVTQADREEQIRREHFFYKSVSESESL